ncbi:MAG: hypothetical protein AB7F19_05105 [Candidatus Babeliales bacterium]
MKRLFLALLVCSASLNVFCAGTRNLIMPIDWGKETIENEFRNQKYTFPHAEFGPPTMALIMALIEQAAPIIVSSSTWKNAVARAQIFKDAVKGANLSYLKKYPLFSNPENIKAFAQDLSNGYDPSADLMLRGIDLKIVDYYYAYQVFFANNPAFKPQEWIVKKLSDYLYLLIPLSYMQEVQARHDTPETVEYEKGKPQSPQFNTPLSKREQLIGMKFEKFPDIPAKTLLDINAHVLQINHDNYKMLVPKRAYNMVQRAIGFKWFDLLKGFLFGQHVIHTVSQLFVTHTDLKFPGGNREKTDVNETHFLHEWLVYLDGHGSVSQPGALQPFIAEHKGGFSAQVGYTAGLEQGAFRELLGFFNNRVNTGSFFYSSCYSGGPHLFKFFEHHWDYPLTQKVGKKVQVQRYNIAVPDVFNYLIIAANQFYTVTFTGLFHYWSDNNTHYNKLPLRGHIKIIPLERIIPQDRERYKEYLKQMDKISGLMFREYFKSMAQLLHPDVRMFAAQRASKKQKVVKMPSLKEELIKTISYVHQFDLSKNYMVPAIRLPYTEWFVSLGDLGAQIQLGSQETEKIRKEREEREAAARSLLPKIIQKGLPAKVKESLKKLPLEQQGHYIKDLTGKERFMWKKQDIAAQDAAAKEKERKEKERKEKELLERMQKMRQEQEEREKKKQKPPIVPQVKPQDKVPLQPLPTQPTIQLPAAPTGGKTPTTLPAKLPPPPFMQGPAQQPVPSNLQQALKRLERSLYYMVDALLVDENGK